MSLLSRLFGGGGGPEPRDPPVEYNGFTIRPEPIAEGSEYRIAARVEKEIGGEIRSHHMIRADTMGSRDGAASASVAKAQTMIDQLGDAIFQ
ncbi:MAG: HlyU family transcriptional regulator [Pseudomonadota bacterium]